MEEKQLGKHSVQKSHCTGQQISHLEWEGIVYQGSVATQTHFLWNKCNAKRIHFPHVKTTTHSSFTALRLSTGFPLLVSSSLWHLQHVVLKACVVPFYSSAVAGSLKSTWRRCNAVETLVGFPPQNIIRDNCLWANVPTISLLTENER